MSSTHASGPSHGSGRVKIKKEPGSGPNHKMEGDGKERPYMCDKCPKAYARRDYLERHLLNHEARNYQCPSCKKGFARIDVLKKHEANACKAKLEAGAEAGERERISPTSTTPTISANPNTSSTTTKKSRQRAIQPQPHPQVQHATAESSRDFPIPGSANVTPRLAPRHSLPSSSTKTAIRHEYEHDQSRTGPRWETRKRGRSTSSRSSVDLDADRDEEGRRWSTASHQSQHNYHPQAHSHQHQHQHQLYLPQHSYHASYPHQQRYPPPLPSLHTSALEPVIHDSTNTNTVQQMPIISPTAPTQPKDMSISLAPAYAPTPDVPTDPPEPRSPKIEPPPPPQGRGYEYEYDNHHGQTVMTTTTTWQDSNHTTQGEYGIPGKVGENMDDLLSWLFNTNAPGQGSDWAYGTQGQSQEIGVQQYLPNFNLDTTQLQGQGMGNEQYSSADPSGSGYTADTGPPLVYGQGQGQSSVPETQYPTSTSYHPAGPGQAVQDNGISMSDPTSARGSISGGHRRYPQPINPLPVPNLPGKTNIPTFTANERAMLTKERFGEIIDEDTRAAMMDMFERPGKEALASPAFSIHRMRLYLELYFMHFAPLYPIIHQPSLRYRRLPPDLLLALICIGTAFAEDKEGLAIASFLHKRLRNRIFEMVEDEPKASVHNLQTLLLINHFSRSYCSLKEHGISQIFHSPSVYMIRLAGTLLPRFNRQNPPSDDPVTCWLDWVGEEERKRLGWFAFMMDLENAALYRHFLMIHCYTMEIPFPTSSSSWTASDPFTWSTALRESLSHPTPSFRNALRELAGRGQIPPGLNDQSLWILIHGLINVSWTLLWRDLGELSMVHENKITGWKDSLRRAFKIWVGYVEGRGSVRDDALFSVGIPFAQLGSILLLSDTEMIRIFAGAANIAGRSISPGEWTAANTYVHAWAKSQDGAYACYTAIELLSQVYKWSAEDRWATAPAFIPWCTYVASLVIWAYSTVLDGPDSLQAPYIIPLTCRDRNKRELEHGEKSEIRIEPSLARRAAQAYLSDMLAQTRGEVFALPDVAGKNACAGVLAYTAYLVGIGGRGVLEEARRVLLGLLGEG